MTHTLVSAEEHERYAELAQRLGFQDVTITYRGAYTDPLIHAYWQGAPVAISLRSGIAGGLGVAFYTGDTSTETDEDGKTWRPGEWDEVLDTSFAGPEVALILGAAALAEWAGDRPAQYKGVRHEDRGVPPCATAE